MAKTWDTVISMTEKYVGDSWYLYLLGAAFLALLFSDGSERRADSGWFLPASLPFSISVRLRPGSL